MPSEPGGIYLHVPFCIAKCRYCDFFSVTDRSLLPETVDAVCAEAGRVRRVAAAFDTVYIGGGTPSLLHPRDVAKILRRLFEAFPVSAGAEVTLEVNPGTVDAASLAAYRDCGVNRLSIGVQSFRGEGLRRLGRIHSPAQAEDAVRAAQRTGFDRISVDLIYGLPGQSAADWQGDLERAVSLRPGHLSCYLLTLEPGTPLHADWERGAVSMPEDAVQGELFSLTQRFLADKGYRQYEISNFARSEADRSRHNGKYWRFAPYIGLGPAAHSYCPPERWWNHRGLHRYLEAVQRGAPPVAGRETLDRGQRMIERIYLGLRTAEGIETDALEKDFGAGVHGRLDPLLEELAEGGFLVADGERLALTPKGMRFHESIARRLIEAV